MHAKIDFAQVPLLNNQLRCWGSNAGLILGSGATTAHAGDEPNEILNLAALKFRGDAMPLAVSVGAEGACAVFSTGRIRCWGTHTSGMLGYGKSAGVMLSEDADDLVFATADLAVAVDLGTSSACALFVNGKLRCWGDANFGILGNNLPMGNNVGDDAGELLSLDFLAFSTADDAVGVGVGSSSACAVFVSGRIRCWGAGFFGQLFNGSNAGNADTAAAPFLSFSENVTKAVSVHGGADFTCALFENGRLRCWGKVN